MAMSIRTLKPSRAHRLTTGPMRLKNAAEASDGAGRLPPGAAVALLAVMSCGCWAALGAAIWLATKI